MTALRLLVEASADVAATSARKVKIERLAGTLRAVDQEDVATTVAWLSGELPQRQIGVGWASLRDSATPAADSTLTVSEVNGTFDQIKATTGTGSQQLRRDLLAGLFGRATAAEQQFLKRLLGGELRQGALLGVMADAVARAAEVPLADVQRAAMLRGDLAPVAAAALAGGSAALAQFRLQVGRPVGPMLAQTAENVDDALTKLGGRAALEWKLDGFRIQVHRDGDEVVVFTRSLDDITGRLPEVVKAVRVLPADQVVLDGEAVALRADGRPLPFQMTAARVGTHDVATGSTVVSPFFFDILHRDGQDLLDAPGSERFSQLEAVAPTELRVRRLVTDDVDVARAFYADTLTYRHEGVVAKSLTAPYAAGRRGAGWLKVKPVHTLDLVVLGVEWGSGRRRGWLSNIHLGARDPDSGGFVMLGKTFKGMTDEMLKWQTERFLELAEGPTDQYVVMLRPQQVVEIAFDGVQASPRYPGGVALRFARVLRYRDDKSADEADTIDDVLALRGE